MNFIFISPQFPASYWNFCDRLTKRGVTVLGIGDSEYDSLSGELKGSLTEYYRVSSLENYDEVIRAAGYFTWKYGKIDWVESNNEYWLTLDARLRTDFHITTGMDLQAVANVRRKSAMKAFYHQAGVPAARYHLVDSLENGLAFAEEVSWPVFVKPDDGMGAEDSRKIRDAEEMRRFYEEKDPNTQYIMEEFISGDIWSYDGISDSQGNILFEAAVSWPRSVADIVNNKDHLSYYTCNEVPEDLREKGRAVVKAFQVHSRFFHLEFFRLLEDKEGLGKKGEIVALEVNMRPAGGYTPDMMDFGHSTDVYQIYADMVTSDKRLLPPAGEDKFCVYAATKDIHQHAHSRQDILDKYGERIVMAERMPDVLSGAMGNEMYTAIVDSEAEVNEFADYVQEKA